MMSENVYKHHHVFQHFFKLFKMFLSKVRLLGDKESKRKQKSPGTAAAAQVVVMRELKWDHQVCTINFIIYAHLAPVTQPLFVSRLP